MIVKPDLATPRQTRQCFTSVGRSKSAFGSRAEAKRYLARHRLTEMRAYRCDECGRFHVGHKS